MMIEPTLLKDKILDAAWQFDWTVQPEKSDEFHVVSLSRPVPPPGPSKTMKYNNNNNNKNCQRMDIYLDTMVVGICPNFALCGRSMLFLTDLSFDGKGEGRDEGEKGGGRDEGEEDNTIWGMMKKTPTQLESSILGMVNCSTLKKGYSSNNNNNNNNNKMKVHRSNHHKNKTAVATAATTTTTTVFHRHVCDFGWKQPVLKKRQWKICSTLMDDEDARRHFMEGFGGAVPDKTSLVELGPTWVVITSDGTSRFGGRCEKHESTLPRLPDGLRRQLHGRQKYMPNTKCLSLSPNGASFFCQFADGNIMSYGLPDELKTALKEKSYLHGRGSHQALVKALALGPNDSYVCIWEDGSYDWSGVDDDLHAALNKGTPGIDIGFEDNGSSGADGLSPCQIKIGSNNEWFIRYVGGAWTVNGHTDECEQAIETIKNDEGGVIVDVHLGNDGMWLIEYEVGEEIGSNW